MNADCIMLEKVHFDNMENRDSDAISRNVVGVFVGDEQLTAHGKVKQWMDEQPPCALYLGHDGKVYPQFRLITKKII